MAKRVDLLQGNIALSLTKLSLPLMGMSFLQMAYNLTDMFWIGRLGTGAVASVGTGGLLAWFCIGVHTISQLGGQVYVAQNLGAGEHKKAGDFAHAAIYLTTFISIFLGLVFTIAVDPILKFFALNDAKVIEDAKNYIMVCCGLIFFQLMTKLLTAMITTTGDSKTPFIATTIGLVFNMLLDPLLIFGFGFIPALGVLGAGIATVFAQAVVFSVLLIYAIKDKHLFNHIKIFSLPKKYCIFKIVKLGFPTTLQATLFPMVTMYLSRMIAGFGDDAVAVSRIGSQVESITWMTAEGFAIAVNSFIAQNYGAKNYERARKGFMQSVIILGIYGVITTILLIVFAKEITQIFIHDANVIPMGIEYLVIVGFSEFFMCLEILSSNAMNAFGKTTVPAGISISLTSARIPFAYMFIGLGLGLCGIWWAFTVSSILKGILLVTAAIYLIKRMAD